MKAAALVSIGLAVFYGAALLDRAVGWLLAQSHRNRELVISDNALTDQAPEIGEAHAARDPRLRPLDQSISRA